MKDLENKFDVFYDVLSIKLKFDHVKVLSEDLI
jgi:hypothetical protein